MAVAEITEYASSFPRLRLPDPDGKEEVLVGQKGDTLIHLELDGENLKKYQISWTSGLTKQSYALKTDLCSGQQVVQLQIVSDPQNVGAAILLDGVRIGELSSQGTKSFDVPLGAHTLAVDKGDSTWTTELHYNSTSPGYDRLPIPVDAFASPPD